MGNLLALGALGMFAWNAFIVRAAARRLEQGLGFVIVLSANVVFAGLLVIGQLVVQGGFGAVSMPAVGLFLAAGILSTYLGRRGYFRSVEQMGPSRAASVQVTNPVFAAVFAWILLGERLDLVDVVAMGVVVSGLVLTSRVPQDRLAGQAPGRMRRLPLSILGPAVVASMCYGLGNVARAGAMDQWAQPIVGGLLGAVCGLVAYLAFHSSARKALVSARSADPRGVWLWAAAGTVTIAGQIGVIAATAYIPVAIAVAVSAATPILVIPASVLLFRNSDLVRPQTALGAALIVAGVLVLMLR